MGTPVPSIVYGVDASRVWRCKRVRVTAGSRGCPLRASVIEVVSEPTCNSFWAEGLWKLEREFCRRRSCWGYYQSPDSDVAGR